MKTTRPNVLFIMDDQHRFDFLGCAGADFVHTPNIDALAARGVRFSTCTTTSPICSPSRMALATGLTPSRIGATDNHTFLPARIPTYYQAFRDNGYRTGVVGKLDLGKPDKYNGRYGDRPRVFGWGFTHPEETEGKCHGGSSPTPIGPYTHYLDELGLLQDFHADYRRRNKQGNIATAAGCSDSILPTEAFEDSYIGRRATRWIENIPDDFPWYLKVSFVGPHDPFDPPTEYADKYRNADVPRPIGDSLDGKPEWVKRRRFDVSEEEILVTRRQYCAEVELIDDQIGRIMQALKNRGMDENTYIVFTSDHGEMLGDHWMYTKHVDYEQSLRVPLIVAGPDIEPGRQSDALVEMMDSHATLCDLVGIDGPQAVDARSFAGILRGAQTEHRAETVAVECNHRCIRTEQWKLIESQNDVTELYDLVTDSQELNNVADQNPDVVKELAGRLRRRFQEGTNLR